jgi:F-type H+-transporting ATPase subunit d
MASRRLASSTVEWAQLAQKIPEAQKASFIAMKGKTDGYVRTINSLPEKLPTIDWAHFNAKITVPGNGML